MAYWINRPLHRAFRKRFVPSFFVCTHPDCNHHVQANHFQKQPSHASRIQKFGRLKPDKRARQKIARAPSIRLFLPTKKITLPANFDLRNVNGKDYTSPIDDQGPEGSCTGHGYRNARGPAERIAGTFQEEASSRMIYEDAKHRGGVSEGAYMIDIMEAAVEDGDCRDHYEPYIANDPDRVGVWPPTNPDSLVDAKNWRIKTFADCMKDADGSPAADPIYNVMAAIYFEGKPVEVQGACDGGTPWTRSWSNAWYVGKMPLPPDNDPLDGGHSYAIIGWKTVDGVIWFIAQNSWGVTNAMGGYFEFPATSLTCKVWVSYGGAEVYRLVDAPSVICPDGQHYDVEAEKCVEDGSEPEPVNCEEQDIACTQDAIKEPDFFTMIYKALMCFFDYFECKLATARLRSMINKTLGKKTSKTKRMTFAKVGIELSLTVKKLKDEGW